MNHFFKNIKNIIIVILVIVIILMQQCHGTSFDFSLFPKKDKQLTEGTVITKIETKWDTVKFDSLVYVPKYRVRVDTVHDTTLKDIDTLSVLKDYYAKYFYTDTLDLDSLGNIIINDTISQNSIIFRE